MFAGYAEPDRKERTRSVASSTAASPASGLASWSRYVLLALTVLFVAGAMGQFFLAGLAVFDSPLRWSEHRSLGHTLDLVGMVIWIPAVLGRAGWRLILASVLLVVLFKAQYAFVGIDEPYVQGTASPERRGSLRAFALDRTALAPPRAPGAAS